MHVVSYFLPCPFQKKNGAFHFHYKRMNSILILNFSITDSCVSRWQNRSNICYKPTTTRRKSRHCKSTFPLFGLKSNLRKTLKSLQLRAKNDNSNEIPTSQSPYERLFSNLNQVTLKRDPGSMSSSVFLVAGTTIGAGILAIPAVTEEAGFFPSAAICILCWLYMVVTGLLVAEVNVNTMCELGSGGVSIVSMAMRTLGKLGVQVACISYLFYHYALLVAYVARSSEAITSFLGIPIWESAILFSAVFGGICYFGSQRLIGIINGWLVLGILVTFGSLVVLAANNIHWSSLSQANWFAVSKSIPIVCLAFVYQNVVPVLCTNLEGDLPRVRTAIVLGTSIPLVMFLVWDAVILGSITHLTQPGSNVADPLLQLRSTKGIVGPLVDVFSFLAIGTSYIGFILGLADFISDLLKLPSGQTRQPGPYVLTIIPPIVLALLNPDIFFKALDFAGIYGVLVLFGVLPAAMAWAERYSKVCLPPPVPPIVPGGKITLSVVIGAAGYVITSELIGNFQH